MTRQTDQRYRRINPVCPPPDKPGIVEERLKHRRAAEQAVSEREERYPVLTAANAQEAIDWQSARIAELMQESAS